MKNLILITLICIVNNGNVFSQKPTTWIGGTPGMKTDWYCPFNWSTSAVPDEFSDVIIPDVSTSSFSLPVLPKGRIEVNSINIHPNAYLTVVNNASLTVFETTQGSIHKVYVDERLLAKNTGSMTGKGLLTKE